MSTETVANLSNEAIAQRDVAIAQPLEQAAETRTADDASVPEAQANYRWA